MAGVVGPDPLGYANFANRPRPQLLSWFPDFNIGTVTGQSQGPWSVSGNDDYVVYGGEFTLVNNKPQQGLVRFAREGLAPNHDGPRLSGSNFVPTLTSFAAGVRLQWPANYDRDNELLSYEVIRDSDTAHPLFRTQQRSTFWQRPVLSYLDTSAVSGQTYSYQVRAIDPHGNTVTGDGVSITKRTTGSALSVYDGLVLNDSPINYWRMDETSGSAMADTAGGGGDGTRRADVGLKATGAIAKDPGTAYQFAGTSNGYAATNAATLGLQTFSLEAWFKTRSASGGKIIGFGSSANGDSSIVDRHLYLTNAGQLVFGTARPAPGAPGLQTISSPASGYNNNQWHHVAATLDPSGMKLFVDGAQVASRTDYFLAQVYTGYWRLGGDRLTGWPSSPTSGYLSGTIDDAAVYNKALSASRIQAHYAARTGVVANPPPPAFVSDPFNRTVASGFGTADVGGAWTTSGHTKVSGGAGVSTVDAGGGTSASLGATTRTSTDVRLNATVDKLPGGSGLYLSTSGRRLSATRDYRAKVQLSSSGAVSVSLVALEDASTETALTSSVAAGTGVQPQTPIHVRMQTFGTSPTTVRAKVWLGTSSEPAGWTVSTTDSFPVLQAAGSVGISTYLSSSAANAPVTLSVLDIEAVPAG